MKKYNKFNDYLQNELTTLAQCWEIKRIDNKEFYFTLHDQDIKFNHKIYKSAIAISNSTIEKNNQLHFTNFEIKAIINNNQIQKDDLLLGKFDQAEIKSFLVNYNNPEEESLLVNYGYIAAIRLENKQFIAEIKGFEHKLNQSTTDTYSSHCSAKFADDKCKIDPAKYIFKGEAIKIIDDYNLIVSDLKQETGYFDYGVITFISGNNINIAREVKKYLATDKKIILAESFPLKINIDDKFTIRAGCNKNVSCCHIKFNNVVNFRGFPYLLDKF